MTATFARMRLRALVSIHDVMPDTRVRVTELLRSMPATIPPASITLLVVPGRHWSPTDLDWLRSLQQQGYGLAGHGWSHRCARPRTLYHRLHSLMLSRDAAEHLSLDADGIAELIRANQRWFADQGIEIPELYVPPAWALGPIALTTLQHLPFRYYETLTGIQDTATGRFRRLPVIGFEADTPARAALLRLINLVQLRLARWLGRPVRLAVHPYDAELYLARDLRAALAAVQTPLLPSSARLWSSASAQSE
jgi:predicted deacetylase